MYYAHVMINKNNTHPSGYTYNLYFLNKSYFDKLLIEFINICLFPLNYGGCNIFKTFRYYYNKNTKQCQKFLYGGCNGNENNFINQQKCISKCGNGDSRYPLKTTTLPPDANITNDCLWPRNEGEFSEEYLTFLKSFLQICHTCVNINSCVPDLKLSRWYFDARHQLCRRMSYSGCGGNPNNFPKLSTCLNACRGPEIIY